MDLTIQPRKLSGTVAAIPSKSQAHRYLICAAFSDSPTQLICPQTNLDMEATANCLRALGADIIRSEYGYHVTPVRNIPTHATLHCGESGSTLRFMLPIVAALGVDATFTMAGRLPSRPLSPLDGELVRMGCEITRPTADTLRCRGKLKPGNYSINGSVSSQFITGLMFAHSLMTGESTLEITGNIESKPYIEMTRKAMTLFSAPQYHSPGTVTVEGDWSNGAFFLAARQLGNSVTVTNLSEQSCQGDKAEATILPQPSGNITVDISDIPDLVPILAVTAAANKGATFTHIQRLRLKESDRVSSTVNMICQLGGKAEATEDSLTVFGTGLRGGTVDSVNDHRIAMAAAIAATVCKEPVTILQAQATNKSYPSFWEEYRRLGGSVCEAPMVKI